MQSKSLFLFFIIIVTLPLIAIATNHEIFFIVVSLIIAIIASKYMFKLISGEGGHDNKPFENIEEELEEELEELINIDIKKFGTGLSVVYNMLVILYLCYCAFFLNRFILKVIASFAILFQIHFIIKKTGKHTPAFNPYQSNPQSVVSILLNTTILFFTIISKLKI